MFLVPENSLTLQSLSLLSPPLNSFNYLCKKKFFGPTPSSDVIDSSPSWEVELQPSSLKHSPFLAHVPTIFFNSASLLLTILYLMFQIQQCYIWIHIPKSVEVRMDNNFRDWDTLFFFIPTTEIKLTNSHNQILHNFSIKRVESIQPVDPIIKYTPNVVKPNLWFLDSTQEKNFPNVTEVIPSKF